MFDSQIFAFKLIISHDFKQSNSKGSCGDEAVYRIKEKHG